MLPTILPIVRNRYSRYIPKNKRVISDKTDNVNKGLFSFITKSYTNCIPLK